MTHVQFQAWAFKNLGFYITPGSFRYGTKKPKGYLVNGTLYGEGTVVYKQGGCHPASLPELRLWKALKKGMDVRK